MHCTCSNKFKDILLLPAAHRERDREGRDRSHTQILYKLNEVIGLNQPIEFLHSVLLPSPVPVMCLFSLVALINVLSIGSVSVDSSQDVFIRSLLPDLTVPDNKAC